MIRLNEILGVEQTEAGMLLSQRFDGVDSSAAFFHYRFDILGGTDSGPILSTLALSGRRWLYTSQGMATPASDSWIQSQVEGSEITSEIRMNAMQAIQATYRYRTHGRRLMCAMLSSPMDQGNGSATLCVPCEPA